MPTVQSRKISRQGSTTSTGSGIALLNPAWIPAASMAAQNFLNWSSVSGQVYRVWSTTNLTLPFAPFGNTVTAATATVSFPNNPTNAARYFKVQLVP